MPLAPKGGLAGLSRVLPALAFDFYFLHAVKRCVAGSTRLANTSYGVVVWYQLEGWVLVQRPDWGRCPFLIFALVDTHCVCACVRERESVRARAREREVENL